MPLESAPGTAEPRVRFGRFELDRDRGELRRDGTPVKLQRHPWLVLETLLQKPGELVTRDQLRDRLWGDGTHVEFEDGLNTAIARLRRSLGDDADHPVYVQTVPGRGYRFVAPVVPVIQETPGTPAAVAPTRTRQWLTWTAGLVLVVAVAIAWTVLATRRRDRPPRIVRALQLTAAPGLEQRPTWSPDSTRLAYVSDRLGEMDVWVEQPGTSAAVPLTKDVPGDVFNPAWSADSSWIAFASLRDGGGIDVVPAVGGAPRRVAEVPFAPSPDLIGSVPTIAWSPDSTRIVYGFGIESRAALVVVPARGGAATPIELPAPARAFSVVEPAWAPDGKRIAFAALGGSLRTSGSIWVVNVEDRSARAVTSGGAFDQQPQWSADGRRLFFLSDRGGTTDVWSIALDRAGAPAGEPSTLTLGAGVGSFAVTRDGRRLAYSRHAERSNIWSIELRAAEPLRWEEARPVTSEEQVVEFLEVSRDGRRIVFDSTRGGNSDVWTMLADGSDLRRVTDDAADEWHPSLSPDGTQAAFHRLLPDGNREIFAIGLAGGPARRLTDRRAKDWCPRWSPDGRWIVFATDEHGTQDIAIVAPTGGDVQLLVRGTGNDHNPLWSPDGASVVFASNREGSEELYTILRTGGRPARLTREGWDDLVPLSWRDAKEPIYVWARGGGRPAGYWAVDPASGKAEPILSSHVSRRQLGVSLGGDGRRVLFPAWERLADLWLAELGS
jgi:Tol biopolymer transport system component/DNA-binding winged helix-turn-helix (wHTH) protein